MFSIEVVGAKLIRDVDPHSGARGSDAWFRWDWVPETGIVVRLVTQGQGLEPVSPDWSIQGRVTHPRYEVDRNHRSTIRIFLSAVARGDRIDVHCRIGSTLVSKRIWIIKGEVRVRSRGEVSPQNRNQARRRSLRALFEQGHAPRSLGLFTYASPSSGERLYGGLVEIVGIVDPWDVPTRFHLVRRIVSQTVSSNDGTNIGDEIEIGQDDTSATVLQDQSLSQRGYVYDIDAPGSHFNRTDAVGLEHSWNVLFEQVLAIGPLLSHSGWYVVEYEGLGISPAQRWHANYRARVVEAGSPPVVRIEGSIGESH